MSTQPQPEKSEPKKSGFARWKEATQKRFQSMLPESVLAHSTQITNAGLLVFTSTMIASAFRGKAISRDIFNAQEKLLQETGLAGEALTKKTAELVQTKVMKPPALHTQRMVYLGTAISSFAIGAFVKDKPKSPEEKQRYADMKLPEYAATCVKDAFDPAHHSRQTAGMLGMTSGALAIISSLSQPGGVHKSEMVVGGTLLAGFSALTFMRDPAKAKQAFSACWWARLPVVITGTHESLYTYPEFKHPLSGMKLKLPHQRMDISYPIGQWGNMAFAAFGFLTAGADERIAKAKHAAAHPQPTVTEAESHGKAAPQAASVAV